MLSYLLNFIVSAKVLHSLHHQYQQALRLITAPETVLELGKCGHNIHKTESLILEHVMLRKVKTENLLFHPSFKAHRALHFPSWIIVYPSTSILQSLRMPQVLK